MRHACEHSEDAQHAQQGAWPWPALCLAYAIARGAVKHLRARFTVRVHEGLDSTHWAVGRVTVSHMYGGNKTALGSFWLQGVCQHVLDNLY